MSSTTGGAVFAARTTEQRTCHRVEREIHAIARTAMWLLAPR
jgi:hypothetical protein